jgi:hypothetical protein
MTDVPRCRFAYARSPQQLRTNASVPNQTPLIVASDSKLFAERDGCKKLPVMTRRGVMLTGMRGPLPVEAIVTLIDCHRNTEKCLSMHRTVLFIAHINKINRAVRRVFSCEDIS